MDKTSKTREELIYEFEELQKNYDSLLKYNEELSAFKSNTRKPHIDKNQLLAILDAIPFPVCLVDLEDNKIKFWSRSAFELFGLTAPTSYQWYEIAFPN